MPKPSLDASWLKVKRADKDIKRLDVAVHNFNFGNPYRIEREPSTEGREISAKFRPDDIPDELPDTTTKIVRNLRAALDNLAWEVANRAGAPAHPESVRFPIFKEGKSLDEPGPQGKIKHVGGQDWLDFIKTIKPYPGGNDLLVALHSLDIVDKHRDFIVTGFLAPNMSVGPIALGDNVTIGALAALNDGDVIVRFPARNNPNINLNIQVGFRNVEIFKAEPILDAVHRIRDQVVRVLTVAEATLF